MTKITAGNNEQAANTSPQPKTATPAVKVGATPAANREKAPVLIGARSPAFKRK